MGASAADIFWRRNESNDWYEIGYEWKEEHKYTTCESVRGKTEPSISSMAYVFSLVS